MPEGDPCMAKGDPCMLLATDTAADIAAAAQHGWKRAGLKLAQKVGVLRFHM